MEKKKTTKAKAKSKLTLATVNDDSRKKRWYESLSNKAKSELNGIIHDFNKGLIPQFKGKKALLFRYLVDNDQGLISTELQKTLKGIKPATFIGVLRNGEIETD